MVNAFAVRAQTGGPGAYNMANDTRASTSASTMTAVPMANRSLMVAAPIGASTISPRSSLFAGVGARALIAARKSSMSSGLNTAVLLAVTTTVALALLVTYQVHLPSFEVRNRP